MTIGQHTVTVTPAAGGDAVDLSCWVDQVAIRHGRDDAGQQPEASSATLDLATQIGPWPAAVDIGALVRVTTDIQTLEPGPATLLATNTVTNPSVENSATAAMGSSNVTLTQVTGWATEGSKSLRVANIGTGVTTHVNPRHIGLAAPNNNRHPCVAGDHISWGCDVQALRDFGVRPSIVFYDAAGASLGSVIAGAPTTTVLAGETFAPVALNMLAPPNAVCFAIFFHCYDPNTSQTPLTTTGDLAQFDRFVAINSGAAVLTSLPRFTGDTPDTSQFSYAWLGTPHNSASTKTALGYIPTSHLFTRFVGRITDMTLGWDDAGEATPDAGLGQVVAVSALADIARRVVGAEPFPQELDGARVARVLTLAGFPPDPLVSDPGTVQILPRDIDSQAALSVAQEVAVSANGILWQTREAEIRYADSEHRRGIATSLELDSCDVLVTPSWQRSLEGLINKVSLGYGPEPDGGEQPRYVAENPTSIAARGTYDYSLTTVLAALADAQAMGDLLLVRNSTPVWIMSSLPVDMKSLDDARTMALLGLDMHALVSLTGLPALGGAPSGAQLWVEGWTETLAWGTHDIQLAISGYCRTAPAPRWDDVPPGSTWDSSPGSWDDATCLGPPPSYGRWTDVPSSLRWDQVDTAVTWDTWNM